MKEEELKENILKLKGMTKSTVFCYKNPDANRLLTLVEAELKGYQQAKKEFLKLIDEYFRNKEEEDLESYDIICEELKQKLEVGK